MPYGDDGDYSDDGDHGDHDNNKVKIARIKMVGSETVKRAIYNLFTKLLTLSILNRSSPCGLT